MTENVISRKAEALSKALRLLDNFAGDGIGHTDSEGETLDADDVCAELANEFGLECEPGWWRKVAEKMNPPPRDAVKAEDAEALLAHPSRGLLHRAIYDVLRDHRMSNMADEDGTIGYPLVDLMSNQATADIGTGMVQMVELADEIVESIPANGLQLDRKVGMYGSAYDPPGPCRAYTYEHQPSNLPAYSLGRAHAAAAAMSAGDNIDRGLGLLKALEEQGFGVFEIEQGGARDD